MARIRTIKPEFFTSEQIVECSTSARLLFVGLWCFCDDGGVHPASVKRLKMEVFPGDTVTDDEIQGMVRELISNGLLEEFEAGNERYWHVSGWDRHQKVDRPTIKYPRPDAPNSTSVRRGLVEQSTTPRDGMESNGMDNTYRGPQAVCSSPGEINQQTEPAPSPKATRFQKPTVAEIQDYCRQIGSEVDAQSFVDFYESNGWKVGKNPMRDWKAAFRNWSSRDRQRDGPAMRYSDRTLKVPRVPKIHETKVNSLGHIIR
ncbi:hypothetical protein [Schlesneria sp. T3-172]|uniref:hypothetical protein n=1 Tax=Schlesneria sphaerica TaxID=3373610 RepID=UPI0037CBBA17